KDIPQLIIEVATSLVASASVKTPNDSRLVTLVGAVGKSETLSIPMVFLPAFLEKDLDRFAIIARDAVYTTWEVPGVKPVRLPNDFTSELGAISKYQSVAAWLGEFGTQGRCIAPLIAGSLLGLAFQDTSQPVPVNKQGFTTDELVGALESMAFKHGEAEDMVNRVMPRLKADMTLEEAIRITLQTGKGGD
ncbi:MAG: RuvA C-terminal domain-containing protein, partial [Dehalococcoidales bacterium]|nr:RuvA C-terminal domain-containing protein [Dehalococcoidales bacterium]